MLEYKAEREREQWELHEAPKIKSMFVGDEHIVLIYVNDISKFE